MAKTHLRGRPPRPRYRRLYIAEWIEHLGRKQREVAEAAGISESHFSLVASGQRPYVQGKVEAIAAALGIEPGQLHYPPSSEPLWAAVAKLGPDDQVTAARLLAALKSAH